MLLLLSTNFFTINFLVKSLKNEKDMRVLEVLNNLFNTLTVYQASCGVWLCPNLTISLRVTSELEELLTTRFDYV